jgi:hypothetical protein
MLGKVIIVNGQKKIQELTADTGTGAPVGSIIVVCSNILPSGYLGLGVQYDITNYPALYQVLGTDTTPTASALGLPTLSSGQYAIKATSGLTENQQEDVLNTINENNSYSTEEHPTGAKWIDGKPIYRKVFVHEGTGSDNPSFDYGTISSFGQLIEAKTITVSNNGGNQEVEFMAYRRSRAFISNGVATFTNEPQNPYSVDKYILIVEYTKN